MIVRNRRSPRQLIYRLAVLGLALWGALALAPPSAAAQGTPQQRAACESEAQWLCSNYIPDERAITACMVRNRHLLSPRCRAFFREPAKGRKR